MGLGNSHQSKEADYLIQLDRNRISADGHFIYGVYDNRQIEKPLGETKDLV